MEVGGALTGLTDIAGADRVSLAGTTDGAVPADLANDADADGTLVDLADELESGAVRVKSTAVASEAVLIDFADDDSETKLEGLIVDAGNTAVEGLAADANEAVFSDWVIAERNCGRADMDKEEDEADARARFRDALTAGLLERARTFTFLATSVPVLELARAPSRALDRSLALALTTFAVSRAERPTGDNVVAAAASFPREYHMMDACDVGR